MIELIQSGYNVVVLDNLVNSKSESLNRVKKIVGKEIPFEQIDLKDAAGVEKVFQKYNVSNSPSYNPHHRHIHYLLT